MDDDTPEHKNHMPFQPPRHPRPARPDPDWDLMEAGPPPDERGAYMPQPEDFRPTSPMPLSPLRQMPAVHHVRPALLMLVFFVLLSALYWREGRGDWLWVSGALFTHSDLGHLLANAPLFLIFGWFLRAFFGLALFPGVALGIGVASNLVTIATYEPTVRLVGASGMLYGMVALWLVLYIRFDTDQRVLHRWARALAFSLVILFPTTFQPTTSYLAHGVGFGFGLLVGLIVGPWLTVRPPAPPHRPQQES